MYILFFLFNNKNKQIKIPFPRDLLHGGVKKSSPKSRPNFLRAENFAGKLLWRKALISVKRTPVLRRSLFFSYTLSLSDGQMVIDKAEWQQRAAGTQQQSG